VKNVIIVGAGGFGREVFQYVQDTFGASSEFSVKGFLDDGPRGRDDVDAPARVIGSTSGYAVQSDDVFVVAVGTPAVRQLLTERLASRGARFLTIIHPRAYVASTAQIDTGCIVPPFAMVSCFARLAPSVVLGVCSAVGHDAEVGPCAVVSPFAAVCGAVVLEAGVFLGSHATITPGKRVGANTRVAAGAVVYRDVPANVFVVGNPARALSLAQTSAESSSATRDVSEPSVEEQPYA
jgi:sugar O-acyltransferase (sialic acid O-acetyltransferase NeuD family)